MVWHDETGVRVGPVKGKKRRRRLLQTLSRAKRRVVVVVLVVLGVGVDRLQRFEVVLEALFKLKARNR